MQVYRENWVKPLVYFAQTQEQFQLGCFLRCFQVLNWIARMVSQFQFARPYHRLNMFYFLGEELTLLKFNVVSDVCKTVSSAHIWDISS